MLLRIIETKQKILFVVPIQTTLAFTGGTTLKNSEISKFKVYLESLQPSTQKLYSLLHLYTVLLSTDCTVQACTMGTQVAEAQFTAVGAYL